MFIINCKNYDETSGEKILKLVKISEKISKKTGVKIAIAPGQHQIALLSKSKIPIFSQHLDNAKVGSTTGFMVPEIVKKSNIKGSLVNHSEHRIPEKDISEIIERLRSLKLVSVLCVKDVDEAKIYEKLEPNYIAIEPPELIGSGKAVSKERPELITEAVNAVREQNKKTKLLCGAGLVSGEDVKKALELGSEGILVASGIVKSKNWEKIILEFAKAML